AIGFLVSGNIAALSWRAPFEVLAALGLILAYFIARKLPEPRRGGRGRLEPDSDKPVQDGVRIRDVVREHHIEPNDGLVLRDDPARMRIWPAVKYVLSLPTYRMLIIASALGYFYFTGLRTFVVVFMRSRFHLAQTLSSTFVVVIGLGAIAGVLVTGLLADRMVARGRVAARMRVGAFAYFLAVAALLPAMLLPNLAAAAPFMFIAAGGLGGAFPPVDAARLDVMHSRLWGRAEGVRSTIVYLAQAGSPPLFGWLSALLGGRGGLAFGPAGGASGGQGGRQPRRDVPDDAGRAGRRRRGAADRCAELSVRGRDRGRLGTGDAREGQAIRLKCTFSPTASSLGQRAGVRGQLYCKRCFPAVRGVRPLAPRYALGLRPPLPQVAERLRGEGDKRVTNASPPSCVCWTCAVRRHGVRCPSWRRNRISARACACCP